MWTPPPKLPATAIPSYDKGSSAGQWLTQYMEYAEAVSPLTPRAFHESAGLWLISLVVARRLVLHMSFDDIFPNLFIVWIAKTTLFRKSTGLNIARRIALDQFDHLLAAQDTTPEAFMADMAGMEPEGLKKMSAERQQTWQESIKFSAQRGLVLDEMSGLLAGAGRDYNAGLIEALLRFYDCDDHFRRSTRRQGIIDIRRAYLTFLGASTPAALGPHLGSPRLWSNGWWSRFAMLTPQMKPRDVQDEIPGGQIARPASILDGLKRLDTYLTASCTTITPISVLWGDGALEDWNRYHAGIYQLLVEGDKGIGTIDQRLYGSYGRLHVQALKVAILLAAMDRQEDHAPKVEQVHLAWAINIVERWRLSAHEVMAIGQQSAYHLVEGRITKQLTKHGEEGRTFRELCVGMRDLKPGDLRDVLGQLIDSGQVRSEQTTPGPNGGKPTERFYLTAE